MKLITVIGARPQFIKAAVVSRLLRDRPGVEELLIHTGQHYDENMSDVFFDELAIPKPAFHRGVGSGKHGAQTGRMLEALEQVMLDTRPDKVVIYGDTNSTLAGALAAAKLHIPIAHVEAGLRSFNRRMPEEINRVMADHLSDALFAPTELAVRNLRHEGIADAKVFLVGDVMCDAARFYGARAKAEVVTQLGLEPKKYVLATIHRAENTDPGPRLWALMDGLSAVAAELPVVLPLHPRTRAVLAREGVLEKYSKSLRLLEPLGYLDMVALEKEACLIATDSGGVQKEAFFHGVPCVTLRDETEWMELVELGWNRLLSPTDARRVHEGIVQALHGGPGRAAPPNLYGGGRAGEAIATLLERPG
jgi:UDP-GlcNAc3NAcA epimerase